jgi:hypothetical protein
MTKQHKSYPQIMQEERRLLILQLLAANKPEYRAQSGMLREALAGKTHTLSRDQMHTELAWLAEQGLLVTEVNGPVVVATLSARGLDVSEGTAAVPGVKRPDAFD